MTELFLLVVDPLNLVLVHAWLQASTHSLLLPVHTSTTSNSDLEVVQVDIQPISASRQVCIKLNEVATMQYQTFIVINFLVLHNRQFILCRCFRLTTTVCKQA